MAVCLPVDLREKPRTMQTYLDMGVGGFCLNLIPLSLGSCHLNVIQRLVRLFRRPGHTCYLHSCDSDLCAITSGEHAAGRRHVIPR